MPRWPRVWTRSSSGPGITNGEAEIKALGLDLFGGCYNPRLMRGGSSLSTHSWATAINWDPEASQLKWGRERNYDWMHVQATLV